MGDKKIDDGMYETLIKMYVISNDYSLWKIHPHGYDTLRSGMPTPAGIVVRDNQLRTQAYGGCEVMLITGQDYCSGCCLSRQIYP